jgi:hypothetical protein
MDFNLKHAIDLLRRTPGILRVTLEGIPPVWANARNGDGTWSAYDVLGHLIHGERTDWIPRARIILDQGEARTFDRFDRFAQFEESEGKSLADLLTNFEQLRSASVAALSAMNLTADDLARTGTHPEFGRVTLAQLLATWVAHDQGHLVQIHRTLARQYRDAVGPWTAYLSVMD